MQKGVGNWPRHADGLWRVLWEGGGGGGGGQVSGLRTRLGGGGWWQEVEPVSGLSLLTFHTGSAFIGEQFSAV